MIPNQFDWKVYSLGLVIGIYDYPSVFGILILVKQKLITSYM